MKLSIAGGETFTLTGQTIDKLVRAGNGDAALLYLYMLRTHGQSTDKQIEQSLKKSKGWVADTTALLSRLGLVDIETDTTPPPDPPAEIREYTQDEVVAEINSGSAFSIVVQETSRRLGKPLSPDDMMRLYGIYENLRLPPEVILQLITHCIHESRRSGDRRSPSIKFIEKVAYTWEREGIFTIEKAEEYLKTIEERKSLRGQIKSALQIKNDRDLSAAEKNYFDGWLDMGFDVETITLAYEKTIVNTGKLAYPYMDTILKKWDKNGLHTIEAVKAGDKPRTGKGALRCAARGGDGHGKPDREQMERMTRLLEKINE